MEPHATHQPEHHSQIASRPRTNTRLSTARHPKTYGRRTFLGLDRVGLGRQAVPCSTCNQHLRDLVLTHGIAIRICRADRTQWAARSTRRGGLRTGKIGAIGLHQFPVTSDTAYAVALHEIGHLVSSGQAGTLGSDALAWQLGQAARLSDRYLRDELDAWFWAREHALCWTRAMAKQVQRSLRSYGTPRRWELLGVDSSFAGRLQLDKWFAEYKRQVRHAMQPRSG